MMGLVIQLIQREVLDVMKLPLDVCGCCSVKRIFFSFSFFQPFSEYIDGAFEYFPLDVALLLQWFCTMCLIVYYMYMYRVPFITFYHIVVVVSLRISVCI